MSLNTTLSDKLLSEEEVENLKNEDLTETSSAEFTITLLPNGNVAINCDKTEFKEGLSKEEL